MNDPILFQSLKSSRICQAGRIDLIVANNESCNKRPQPRKALRIVKKHSANNLAINPQDLDQASSAVSSVGKQPLVGQKGNVPAHACSSPPLPRSTKSIFHYSTKKFHIHFLIKFERRHTQGIRSSNISYGFQWNLTCPNFTVPSVKAMVVLVIGCALYLIRM